MATSVSKTFLSLETTNTVGLRPWYWVQLRGLYATNVVSRATFVATARQLEDVAVVRAAGEVALQC